MRHQATPISEPAVSCKQMVVASSQQQYGKSRQEVEKLVAELHTPEPVANNKQTTKKNNSPNSKPQDRKPPHQNNTGPKSAPQTKSPEELRAVLGKISQGNEPRKENKKLKEKKVESENKNDLKSALASVLQNTPKQEASASAQKPKQNSYEEKKSTPAPVNKPKARREAPQFNHNSIDPNVIRKMLKDETNHRSPLT